MDFDNSTDTITPDGIGDATIKIGGTGAIVVPVGTSGQQPTAVTGGIRWNSSTGNMEYSDGATWTAFGTGGPGGGPNSFTATASEALSAGDIVSVWLNSGTLSVRKADASLHRKANGYVTSSVSSSATATVYTEGNITLSGMTVGNVYLGNSGAVVSVAPSDNSLVQLIGYASSATNLIFSLDQDLPGTFACVASEALTAGNLVNLWSSSGNPRIRKADASSGRAADGFVLESYSSSDMALVYVFGVNPFLSGMTVGTIYLAEDGAVTSTVPTTGLAQQVGFALSSTKLNFQRGTPVQL